VPDIVYQAHQIYLDHVKLDGHVKFQGDTSTHAHTQGLVRFQDFVESDGSRVINVGVSFNDNAGFTRVTNETNHVSERLNWEAEGARVDLSIRQAYDHPGGMQAHGNIAVIGMEDPYNSSAGAQAMFVRVTGPPDNLEQEILNTHTIPISQADAEGMTRNEAAAAGFVKLENGYFLLAVAGANHGEEGVWFFESDDTVINSYTEWHLVDVWKPVCVGWGQMQGQAYCWAGAAASVNLLTGCDGSVYMYALTGSRGSGKDYTETQLWKIAQDSNGNVTPEFILQRRKSLGLFSARDPSCRWACGVHVMEEGILTMTATVKQKVGLYKPIETHYPVTVIVPKSAPPPVIPEMYFDDRQEDPAYDASILPSDWTQEIEDEYDNAEP